MTKPPPDGELERAVERRRERRAKWEREGERPLARNMALVGTLGWLVVVPAVLGALGGHVIDHHARTGVTFTLALIFAGTALGCWLAWSHVRRS